MDQRALSEELMSGLDGWRDLARLVLGEELELSAEEEEGEEEEERLVLRLFSTELGLDLCRSRLNQPVESQRPP